MKVLSFVILVITIQLFSSILVETGKKDKYCFYKEIENIDTIHLSYVISGDNDEKVNVVLVHEGDNKVIYEQHNSDAGEYKHENAVGGKHKLCFLPLHAGSYYISFEFFTHYEKGHTVDMAKDQNLHEMKKDVTDITYMFEEMEKNIRFIMDRRSKHSIVIGDIVTSIRHISYLKILVVVLVSLLQVFLIHKFFGGKKSSSSLGYPNTNVFDMSGNSL